jgi:hypothetical protein
VKKEMAKEKGLKYAEENKEEIAKDKEELPFVKSVIEKPVVDNKVYRYFELPNKLKVLLIHDKK